MYEGFVRAVEAASTSTAATEGMDMGHRLRVSQQQQQQQQQQNSYSREGDRDRERFVNGSGYDGLREREGREGGVGRRSVPLLPQTYPFDERERDRERDRDRESDERERWMMMSSSLESSPRLPSHTNTNDVADSLHRFKFSLAGNNGAGGGGGGGGGGREFPNDLDEGSVGSGFSYGGVGGGGGGYYLAPPKVSDSISINRDRDRGGSNSRPPSGPPSGSVGHRGVSAVFNSPSKRDNSNYNNITSYSSYPDSPYSSFNGGRASMGSTPLPLSLSSSSSSSSAAAMTSNRGSASPSKVGSVIWGRDTPLDLKGSVPFIDDATWCCAVCLYAENHVDDVKCGVCDSPNYAVKKVSDIHVCVSMYLINHNKINAMNISQSTARISCQMNNRPFSFSFFFLSSIRIFKSRNNV